MESVPELLLDTSVLVSRGFESLLGGRLAVNDVVVVEYLTVLLADRNEAARNQDQDRARGREEQLRRFPGLLRENGIALVGAYAIEQIERATELTLQRQVDPADALLAVWAGEAGLQVATRDNDFDRLVDICTVLKVP